MSKEKPKPVNIRNAMKTLGITGDVLFERIREDLDRGLIREARAHLNFVDKLADDNARSHFPSESEVK